MLRILAQNIVMTQTRYEPALDGIRAIAVIAVMLFHAYSWRFGGGWIGVDVFFVLSGYLITRLLRGELAASDKIALGPFYRRRFLRLTPPFLAMLVFVFLAMSVIPGEINSRWSVAVAASYLMNWAILIQGLPVFPLGHTWSLAAEEQFYLLWPVGLLAIRRKPLPWVLLSIVAVSAWKYYLFAHGASWDRIYLGFDTRSTPILVGCVIGLIDLSNHAKSVLNYFWPVAVIALCAVAYAATGQNPVTLLWAPDVTALATAIIIVASTKGFLNRILIAKPLVFTGKISYGLYLWHLPLLYLIHQVWRQHYQPLFPLMLSYGFATASYFTIEAKSRQYKKIYEATRRSCVQIPEGIGL